MKRVIVSMLLLASLGVAIPTSAKRGPRAVSALLAAVLALASLAAVATAAASAPAIEAESVSHVTATDATLGAQLNPNGLETEYQFRVVASPCQANPVNCFEPTGSRSNFPVPPGRIASASGSQSVNLDLNSAGLTLEPGREYHYAVFATNSEGTTGGPDQTFTTLPTPSIESESVSHITATDATLEAQINPNGLDTSYHFEIAKSPACLPVKAPYMPCAHTEVGSLPEGNIPSSSAGHLVLLDLATVGMSLEAEAIYSFRVVASNENGTKEGPGQSFTPLDPRHGGYRLCITKARSAFHSARRAAQSNKHGEGFVRAMKRAKRREHRAVFRCKKRFHRSAN